MMSTASTFRDASSKTRCLIVSQLIFTVNEIAVTTKVRGSSAMLLLSFSLEHRRTNTRGDLNDIVCKPLVRD
jgi:hypothetical protein